MAEDETEVLSYGALRIFLRNLDFTFMSEIKWNFGTCLSRGIS